MIFDGGVEVVGAADRIRHDGLPRAAHVAHDARSCRESPASSRRGSACANARHRLRMPERPLSCHRWSAYHSRLPSRARGAFVNLFALLGLGLLLGLRHAADPDHVVAVTAIAARTRRTLPATLLGVVWGLGHTLTLFGVGAGIILFNWTVPP